MLNIDTQFLSEVNESEFWLLMHLSKRLNKENICWPSNKTLTKDTGWTLRTLQKVKAQLISKKLIVVMESCGPGGQTSNRYILNTDRISVYVPVKKFEIPEPISKNCIGGGNLLTPHEQNLPSPHEQKTSNEVLTNEVLDNELFPGLSIPEKVILYFNELRAKFKFKGDVQLNKSRTKLIASLIREGRTEQDIKRVMNLKFSKWGNDRKMRDFLRPETLFGDKFTSYFEESMNQPAGDWTDKDTGPVFVDADYPY